MYAGFLIMAILLLIGSAITTLYTFRLHRITSEILSENIGSFKAAQELELTLFRLRGLVFSFLINRNPKLLKTLEDEKKDFVYWLNEAQNRSDQPGEKKIITTISDLFVKEMEDLGVVLSSSLDSKSSIAATELEQKSQQGFDQLYDLCESFMAANENALYQAEVTVEHSNKVVRLFMYGISIGGILSGGLLGLFISRSITQPLYELVLKARSATGEEMIERIKGTPGSELEALDRHVHALIRRIDDTRADLELNRQRLERAQRLASLGRVAAGYAHEIRNPLTAIKMIVYSIRDELAHGDEKRADLAVVAQEIDRMEGFIQNFLDFAKPPQPAFSRIDLNHVVTDVIQLLQQRLEQLHIRLELKLADHLQPVYADAGQIKQVLVNLVLNAMDVMPDGGVLSIATFVENDKNGLIWSRMQISDTGPGIPEQIRESLFEPFVSLKKDGTGLGLSIAQQIITQHKGFIETNNKPEGGATFTISIPQRNQIEPPAWIQNEYE
jgi:signal transduction histidine kinase